VIVRAATRADVPELARVHTESALAAYAHIALPPEPDGLGRRTRNWATVFDDRLGTPHVAEANGRVVGILNFGPARDEDGAGEVYVLYVHPDHWGSGAGQLLMDRAHVDLGRDHPEAVLSVLADNPRARRFYERNGWALEEVRVEPHFGETPTEVAHYRKRFNIQRALTSAREARGRTRS
jgi:ribosomal protein S18 acetylase RimI-like enzyme